MKVIVSRDGKKMVNLDNTHCVRVNSMAVGCGKRYYDIVADGVILATYGTKEQAEAQIWDIAMFCSGSAAVYMPTDYVGARDEE